MNITSQPLRLIRICTCYLFSLRQTPGFSSRNQFPFVPRAMDSQGRYTSSPASGATYLLSDDGVILVPNANQLGQFPGIYLSTVGGIVILEHDNVIVRLGFHISYLVDVFTTW